MPKRYIGQNVFETAIQRMVTLYEQGHRIVVSFSAGKDSGICLEICLIAAGMTGRLPIEVIMRDEEIMFPGTFEYAHRVAQREDVSFHWIYACQPVINVYNREQPYFWVFDPLLDPGEWVRKPPDIAYQIPHKNIEAMTIPERFPPAQDKNLYAVIGLRTSESRTRLMGLYSSKGYITKPNRHGVRNVRPIYDWKDGDVWKAIDDNKWDYNHAYNTMARLGLSRAKLRIAPPTLNLHGADQLQLAAKAWPGWFERVCHRLPGVRLAAKYGRRIVEPMRRLGETWEQCFKRTCIDEAPEWIRERARFVMDGYIRRHKNHSSQPFLEIEPCSRCKGGIRSWKTMAKVMYDGNPFALSGIDQLKYVEPEFFRPGAGTWDGKPAF